MYKEDQRNLILSKNNNLPQIRNYQLIKKIGEGSYGKIYLAENIKKKMH